MLNVAACSSLTAGGGKSPSPAASGQFSGKSTPEMEEEDAFYEKLNKINESSGLSLLFNFRDTSMDLYRFYKIVTKKGGYHEVTKGRSWDEVAFTLNSENRTRLTPTQLQNIYANILFPFEQTNHYRTSAKIKKSPILPDHPLECRDYLVSEKCTACDSNYSSGKRKHGDIPFATRYLFSDDNNPSKKIQYDRQSSPGFIYENEEDEELGRIEEKRPVLETPTKVKEARKDPDAPLGSRNCYQMYLKMEYDRLKTVHGENHPSGLRDSIVEAWRHLSNDDKKPYIEASKKDKARFAREMAAYEEHKRKQRNKSQIPTPKLIDFARPKLVNLTSPSRGPHVTPRRDSENTKIVGFEKPCPKKITDDYYVALQEDDCDENITRVSEDESVVQMAVGLMRNARPNDPIFQVEWDEY